MKMNNKKGYFDRAKVYRGRDGLKKFEKKFNSISIIFDIHKYYDHNRNSISNYNGEQSMIKIARNLVDYEAGKTIFATALGVMIRSNIEQSSLF